MAGFRPNCLSRRLLGPFGMERSFCSARMDAASARLCQAMGQFFGLHTWFRSGRKRVAGLVEETCFANRREYTASHCEREWQPRHHNIPSVREVARRLRARGLAWLQFFI